MAKVFRPRLLRHARNEAGYSRPELKRELKRRGFEVSCESLKNYERGTYPPTATFLDKVAEVLGLKDATKFFAEDKR